MKKRPFRPTFFSVSVPYLCARKQHVHNVILLTFQQKNKDKEAEQTKNDFF